MSLKLEIFHGNPPFDSALTAAQSVAHERGDVEVAATNAVYTSKRERKEELDLHTYPLIRLYRDGVLIAQSGVMFWSKERLRQWLAANAENPPLVWPPKWPACRPEFRDFVFTQQVRSQVRRHGRTVLPREGYGFLLAATEFKHVVACLPVGETKSVGDWQTRYALVDQARPVADKFAAEFGLVVAGLYHTDYCESEAPPMAEENHGSRIDVEQQIPEHYRDSFLLCRSFLAGETIWGDCVVTWRDSTGWTNLDTRCVLAKPLRTIWNQRRIYPRWRSRWRGSEYMERGDIMIERVPRQIHHPTRWDSPPKFRRISLPIENHPEEEPALETWGAAARIPITDPQDQTQRRILEAIRNQEPIEFIYYGGTYPHVKRRVQPSILYRVEGYPAAYLTGYCEIQKENRTFRLDRVQF